MTELISHNGFFIARILKGVIEMKITYKFISADIRIGEEVTEIEIDEKIGEVITELNRQESNNDRKETRRHTSYSYDNDKVSALADETDVENEVISDILRKNNIQRLYHAIAQLSPKQRDLIQSIYFDNVSVSEYASREGVTQSAISQRLMTARKKLRKFF